MDNLVKKIVTRKPKPLEPQEPLGKRFMSERMLDSMVQSLRAEGYNVSKEQVRATTQSYLCTHKSSN